MNVNIIDEQYNWANKLNKRNNTDYIVFHHEAGYGTAQNIHQIHLNNGWSGIGYHFYVRMDGSIYQGRPIDTVGAHTENFNKISVGLCAEGYYHTRYDSRKFDIEMPIEQKNSLILIGKYLKGLYPNAKIFAHRELNNTLCPGKYFPFDEIKDRILFEEEIDIMLENWQKELGLKSLNELVKKKIIDSPDEHKEKMGENVPYWLFFAVLNKSIK
jgi:N-acetylmuramoyl-L-alanine amidase